MTPGPGPGTIRKMRVPRDPSFDLQRERFALRHCCEDCGFFRPADAGQGELRSGCAHEWPQAGHRRADYDTPAAETHDQVIFCKEFELC